MIEVKDGTVQDYAGDYNVSQSIPPSPSLAFLCPIDCLNILFLKDAELVEAG